MAKTSRHEHKHIRVRQAGSMICPLRRGLLLRDGALGQFVGALVPRLAGMAAHPTPVYLVPPPRLIKALPEIGIFHRLFAGSFPAPRLPASRSTR